MYMYMRKLQVCVHSKSDDEGHHYFTYLQFCGLFYGVLQGRGSKRDGYLRQLGEPKGAFENAREYSGVLSHLPPLDPPMP